MKKIWKIIIMIVVAQLSGIIGSVFTTTAIPTWYAALNKPWFTPPSYMFAPVWLTLYTLMGIAAGLIWASKSKLKQKALPIYAVQLFLNFTWSPIFFGLKNVLLALANIIAMWVAILVTIVLFWKIDKRSAWMLVPYIVWVSIATALNYYVLILN